LHRWHRSLVSVRIIEATKRKPPNNRIKSPTMDDTRGDYWIFRSWETVYLKKLPNCSKQPILAVNGTRLFLCRSGPAKLAPYMYNVRASLYRQ
jgi:hypothetical protein